MSEQQDTCQSCQGTGMQSDDEGWQYTCSVCHGDGKNTTEQTRTMETDGTNRLLD